MASHISRAHALKQLRELRKFGIVHRLAAQEWKEPWQTLIAILMSARTRDDVTIVVGEKLFAAFPSIEAIANATESELYPYTKSINFFRNKTRNIIACARGIVELYGGVVPLDADKLVVLAGVGRKTANVFLAEYGFAAIGVDTHVMQVANALGWSDSQNPTVIEADLNALFPKTKWQEVNTTCVLFGRTNQSPTKKQDIFAYLRSIVQTKGIV